MQIVCTTAQAAARVLQLLLTARLRLIGDFEIRPLYSITPPITFTVYINLTTTQ
jgi:hypothetical protein